MTDVRLLTRVFAIAPGSLALLLLLLSFSAHAGVYDSGIALPRSTDVKTLQTFLETVHQKSLNSGIVNFTPYALLLIKESQQVQQRSEPETARLFTEYARRLAPDTVPVYIAQALADWQDNGKRLPAIGRNMSLALIHSLSPSNIEDFSAMVFENAAALTGAILLTFIVLTLLIAIACLPRLYHDLRHAVSETVPDYAVGTALVLLLAAPLLLRFSVLWLCAWALVLLFGYTDKRTRQALQVCFLVLSIGVAPLIATMGFAKFTPCNDEVKLIWKANYGYCDGRDTALLETISRGKNTAADVFFSLGLIYKRTGSFSSAHKYYEKVLAADPRNYKAAINRGNVYFAESNWDAAIKMYEQACVMNSVETAAAYFNLSRVYQQKFMFSESETALNNAKRLDLSRVSQYLKDYTDTYNRLVIDETIPVSRLWEMAYDRFSANSPVVRDLWGMLIGGLPFAYGPWGFLALLAAMVYAAGSDRFRVAVRCKLCGKSICRRCQHATAGDMICSYCNSLLRRQSKLGYGVKEEKMIAIRRHLILKKLFGLAAGYAIPGAGHFWAGQTVIGAAGMFVFFWLLIKTIIPLVCEGPWGFLFGPRVFEFSVYGTVLLAYWIAMAYASYRLPARSTEENLLLKIVS